MSQASKQVEWCLAKAKREIDECKRLGMREKHRGLLKSDADIEEAGKHIERAEHFASATKYLKDGNFSDMMASTIFYSMYHCFLAIAAKFGYESSNQTCTISLMEYLKEEGKIDIDSKFIELFKYESDGVEKSGDIGSIIELRENYTYGTKKDSSAYKIEEIAILCKELIEKTKEIVYAV